MNTEKLYVVHENSRGALRFQPRLPNGECMWLMPRYDSLPYRLWCEGSHPTWEPALFRSRSRAERLARRGARGPSERSVRRKARREERLLSKVFRVVQDGD